MCTTQLKFIFNEVYSIYELQYITDILQKAKKGQYVSINCQGDSTNFDARVVSLDPTKFGSIKAEEWTEGWEPTPPGPQDPGPLCFTANEDGANVSLIGWDEIEWTQCDIWCHLQYSTDNKATWNTYSGQIIYLDSCFNKKVYFRADPENPNTDGMAYVDPDEGYATKHHKFVFEKSIAASGNIQYLLTSDGSRTDVPTQAYYNLFLGVVDPDTGEYSSTLTQAPELPATTLADYCYCYMFDGCTSLTQAPELPATTLADGCYAYMFFGTNIIPTLPQVETLTPGCFGGFFAGTKIITAPELPWTTLTDFCYCNMFDQCTSLTCAPQLPATTLTDSCYSAMFQGCTSLTQAPALPATTLADSCYDSMFINCTSLTQAPELPATTLANECYAYMLQESNITDVYMKQSVEGTYNPETHGIFNDPGWSGTEAVTIHYTL